MRRDIVSAVLGMIVFTILLGLVYPLAVTAVSQVAFPGNADGQRIYLRGRLVGSRLIGQNFGTAVIEKGKTKVVKGSVVTAADSRYFQSRPSVTEGGAYNPSASTFSNRGPNSTRTLEADRENIAVYMELNTAPSKQPYDPRLTVATIPVDAVSTSGSNLDPEISKANAWIQAYRVAAVRKLPLASVDGLISQYTSGRGLGFSGEEGVNVLELNLALDRVGGGKG